MKIKKIHIGFLLFFIGLVACEEQTPDAFDEISGIYFNNRSRASALQDSTDVTFVYENSNEMEIPVKIQLLGRPVEQARPINIRVSSEDATEEVDYVLPLKAELPANATSFDYVVMLKRTSSLKGQKKTIRLEISANEYFTLPVSEELQASGDTVSMLHYRIMFSDMFTNPPAAWDEDFVGKFTQQKFELVCRVLNIAPADFNDRTIITLAKLIYIRTEMNSYIAEEVAKKEAGLAYDEEVIDPKTGQPLVF